MKKLLFCLFISILTGCTSTSSYIPDDTLDETNASTLIVYTPDTSFNRQNFIHPTIYIDGKKFAKVSINGPLKTYLLPGPHTIGFQRTFFLMPTFEAGNIDIQMEKGKTYYVRYSYDFDDRATNDKPSTTGASSFLLVSNQKGETRE